MCLDRLQKKCSVWIDFVAWVVDQWGSACVERPWVQATAVQKQTRVDLIVSL